MDKPFIMILYLSVFFLFGVVLSVNSETSICTQLKSSIKVKVVVKPRKVSKERKKKGVFTHPNAGFSYGVKYKRSLHTETKTYIETAIESYCCPGYERISESNSPLLCSPTCDPKCANGTCVNPGLCECNEGYHLSDTKVCVPKCNKTCSNGECTAPNVCTCQTGYKLENDECTPDCKKICLPECTRSFHCSECSWRDPSAPRINETCCVKDCTDSDSTRWNVIRTVQELSYGTGESGFEVISIPKDRYVITVDTSCQKFVDNCNQECHLNGILSCSAIKRDFRKIVAECYAIHYPLTEPHKFGLLDNRPLKDEKWVIVHFKLRFPSDHPSSENCRLCYCDAFHIDIDSYTTSIVRLCPCPKYVKKDVRGLQESYYRASYRTSLICLSILASLLSIFGVTEYIRNKRRVSHLDGTPIVPDDIAEEHL